VGETSSAGALFYSVKKQFEVLGKFPSQSYWVKGGSGSIAGPLIEAIEERGGEIRTNSAVSRILIEYGRVRGVAVDQGQRRVPTELLDTQTIETPGNVGRNLIDIQAEGVDGLYLIGERTSAAKVMGVYGAAQAALQACSLISNR
jgi:hypothetical protein